MRLPFRKPPAPNPIAPEAPPPPDPCATLPGVSLAPRPLASGEVSPGFWIDIDTNGIRSGTWASPRGRLLEMRVDCVDVPGGWLAVHLGLPHLCDLTQADYLGVIMQSTAAEAMLTSLCLRSGRDEGFSDHFFAHKVLSQPGMGDHQDVLVPARYADLPGVAHWRELILFLPVHRRFDWVLHDLRVFTI